MDKEISSMAEKFMFHSFSKHAQLLQLLYTKYIDKSLPESELTWKLNVLKFLLCMSTSPTTFFWEHPEQFQFVNDILKKELEGTSEDKEEIVDWAAYLNEGIEPWRNVQDNETVRFYENKY